MKKLLIATDSARLGQMLQECLSKQFDILLCSNGNQAIELLHSFSPDILAVDLMLSGIDGLGVIKMARSAGVAPKVVAWSAYISGYITAALDQLHIDYLIRPPFDCQYLAARIVDVAQWNQAEFGLDRELRNTLTALGFRPNHAGSLITEACIRQYVTNPAQVLSSQLYPAVAREFGTSVSQVERAMGRAVEAAWSARNEILWRVYFPVGKNGNLKKPSNARFLAVMGACLQPWTQAYTDSLTG